MTDFPNFAAQTLDRQIQKALLQMMRAGAFKDTGKLPPEEELARELGVSRTAIRDALAALEAEGFISRRRGIGTVINQPVLAITGRLDLEMEFLDTVAEAGYQPAIAFARPFVTEATEVVAQRLQIQEGARIYLVERLILADATPVIFCRDHFAYDLIKDFSYCEKDLQEPIFNFIRRYCHQEVVTDLTEVIPALADERIASLLEIKFGDPILHLDEVGYNQDQCPILWSQEYYRLGILRFTLLRRKI